MTVVAKHIVSLKGGVEKFAGALHQRPATVRQWIWRKKFPRTIWPEIVEAYPDITLEQLKLVEASADEINAARGKAA